MIYDKKYFIEKFTAIPDEQWCVGDFADGYGRFCAQGHCGDRSDISAPPECCALKSLLFGQFDGNVVADVNDGKHHKYQQPTPKARILAALHDLP